MIDIVLGFINKKFNEIYSKEKEQLEEIQKRFGAVQKRLEKEKKIRSKTKLHAFDPLFLAQIHVLTNEFVNLNVKIQIQRADNMNLIDEIKEINVKINEKKEEINEEEENTNNFRRMTALGRYTPI